MASKVKKEKKTLYERLGGDANVGLFTGTFFDEIVENTDLEKIFENTSISALKTHQMKLFRVIFGPEEERPAKEDFMDFMFLTHARLFRECGMDEAHFDMVAECFVRGLETFQVAQEDIDEALEIIGPVRAIFEEGARVAAAEKTMTPEELRKLPVASTKTMGTGQVVTLPTYSTIEIPDWLPVALGSKKKSNQDKTVRQWTCDLTNRFGEEGDKAIADTFLDQPYMDHHVYLVAFLQLAFMPDDATVEHVATIRDIVKYPRGREKAPLSQFLFNRMIAQFKRTFHQMEKPKHAVGKAVDRLYSHHHCFSVTKVEVGGITAPHCLSKKPQSSQEEIPIIGSLDAVPLTKTSKKSKQKDKKNDDETVSTVTDKSSVRSSSSSRGTAWRWFRLVETKK